MGKRAREADAAPPLSALARRKAAKAAAEPSPKSAPASAPPAKAPAPPKPVEKPAEEVLVAADAEADTSSSSSDEEDDDGVRDAERLALKGPDGQRSRSQRYFAVKEPRGRQARSDEVMDEDERPTSPVSDDEPDEAPVAAMPTPSTPPRLAVDPVCKSTFAPTLGSNMLHEGSTRILGLQLDEVRCAPSEPPSDETDHRARRRRPAARRPRPHLDRRCHPHARLARAGRLCAIDSPAAGHYRPGVVGDRALDVRVGRHLTPR